MAVTWKRNAGRVMCAGDSITVGELLGTPGGWRKLLFETMAAAGVAYTTVGPYSTNPGSMPSGDRNHCGLSGDEASVAKTTIGADATTYLPDTVIYGYGANDIGTGASSATYLDDLDAVIDAVQAARPNAKHIVQTLCRPTSGHGYFAYDSVYATAAAALPARVASQGAVLANIGTPAQSDNLHPTSAGYDSMAPLIYTALLAAIP